MTTLMKIIVIAIILLERVNRMNSDAKAMINAFLLAGVVITITIAWMAAMKKIVKTKIVKIGCLHAEMVVVFIIHGNAVNIIIIIINR